MSQPSFTYTASCACKFLLVGSLLSFNSANATILDDIVNKIFCATICVPGLACHCLEAQNLCRECPGPGIKINVPKCLAVKNPKLCIIDAGKIAGGVGGAIIGGGISGADGAAIGAGVGGAIGTVVPGVGNTVGAVIGGVTVGGVAAVGGGVAGASTGVEAGDWIVSQILTLGRGLCKGNHMPSKNLLDKFCVAFFSPPQK
ncbi:MAG: hypothetical protein ACRCUQ_04925 [Alphaproteobacteria bacterium]